MIREIVLPQLSMGMSEGTVVEWLAKEGEWVKRDQPFVSIETEKVVTELPAPYDGYIHLIAKPGEAHSVDAIIAKIADSEEGYRSLTVDAQPPSLDATSRSRAGAAPRATPCAGGQATAQMPRSRRVIASGLTKAVARGKGIDLTALSGTGPGGRIVRRDLMAAERRDKSPIASASGGDSSFGMREKGRIPLVGMRAAIAQKMVTAASTAAQTSLFFEVDLTELRLMREAMSGNEEVRGNRISLIAFYARALALACQNVPVCNSTLVDGQVVLWENVNVGVAVALPGRGPYDSALAVPVVRDVQSKGVSQIDQETKALVKAARAGQLSPSNTAGGTITLSSTDGFLPGGWMVSAPLLNLPQVVAFQPGTPVERPVVVDGQIVVRTMLPCGLTYDHRATDGEPIGRFVTKLRDLISEPELLLQ